jgi:hypothetical protein
MKSAIPKRDGKYCNWNCYFLKTDKNDLDPYCQKLKKKVFFDYHGFIAECEEKNE